MGTQHVASILDGDGNVKLKAVAGGGGSFEEWECVLLRIREALRYHELSGETVYRWLLPLHGKGSLVVQEERAGRVWLLGHEDAEEGQWMDAQAELEATLALPYVGAEWRAELLGQAQWGYPSLEKFREWDWNPRWRHGTADRRAFVAAGRLHVEGSR